MSIWKIVIGCALAILIIRVLDYLIAVITAAMIFIAALISMRFGKKKTIVVYPQHYGMSEERK